MENDRCYLKTLILFGIILVFFPVFGYCQTSTVNISVSAQVGALPPPPPPPPPAPPGVIYIPPETKVIFKGRAYPLANLTILKNETVIATFKAENSGLFEREIRGLAGGTYTFSIFAEDTEGRQSVTLSFIVTILEGRITTISGIFLPPTIEISPIQVERGDIVNIFGQTFPESKVNIFISPEEIVKETIASSQGKWFFKLDTASLKEGKYKVRAKAFYGEGEQSPFSQTLSFLVLVPVVPPPKCWGADLNFDGKVNIIDFSILLYFWHRTSPENICTDINQDGIVNLIDFSIMMYWWTG